MDYEKKYNEALKDVRAIYPNLKGDAKLAVEHAFPELAESEDERIINAIIGILKNSNAIDINVSQEKMFAWLEKQKYDRMKPIYDAKESFESALEKAWSDYHNGYENVDKLEDDYVECAHAKGFREGFLYGLEKQKERGPLTKEEEYILHRIIEYLEDETCPSEWISLLHDIYCLPYKKQKEQNPAEWSEEDEKFLEHCSDILDGCGEPMCALRLKSLRPQPKQEWSEEDEEMYSRIVRRYTDYEGVIMRTKEESVANKMLDAMAQEEIWLKERLKSLRPSWKPSEEQMEVLGRFSNPVLISLYEQLKKLM